VIEFLLTLLIALSQGIPALPGQSGTVTGVLRTAAGEPAAGVRVSAMVPPESDVDVRSVASFAALAETDMDGRYRLEGIPQGRYYIVAGRVDQPTYYPGTTEMTKARIFSVTPGGFISGIDFVMVDSSVRSNLPGAGQLQLARRITIPTQVAVEGGGKLPVFAAGGFTQIRLTETGYSSESTVELKSSSSFDFSISSGQTSAEYNVSVDYLPEGYFVKSMTFGADNVMTGTLKIPQANMPRTIVSNVGGITQQVITQVSASGVLMPTLTITLSTTSLPPVNGVRVSGHVKDTGVRSIYISGNPGTLYSDGTFEFRGVRPGRHVAAAVGRRPGQMSLAASIVVGDHDLEGLELQETATLPSDVKLPSEPGPAGTHAPGSVLPLASLRGRALEESSGRPIEEGSITLVGRDQVSVAIGAGGQFEFPKLLPGTYRLDLQIFGHSIIHQPVAIGDDDINLDVKSLRLY